MPPENNKNLEAEIKKVIQVATKEHGPSIKAVDWARLHRINHLQLKLFKDRNLRSCGLCVDVALDEALELVNKKNETVLLAYLRKCSDAQVKRREEKLKNKAEKKKAAVETTAT